jgi:hypothetical protein
MANRHSTVAQPHKIDDEFWVCAELTMSTEPLSGENWWNFWDEFILYPDSSIVRKTACHEAILGFVMGHDLRRLFVSR